MRYDEIQWEDEEESSPADKQENKESEGSFAELLASGADEFERQSIRVGGQVTGIISSINPQSTNVLVEIDPLHTGVIDKQDLLDEDGELKYRAGDQITAYVVSRKGGDLILSSSMSSAQQSIDDLRLAQQQQMPVKGKVSGENKGGFEVSIMGKQAFCPVSQMDTRYVQSKAEYLGKEFLFLIEKVEEGGRNIVVSRSKLLRQEAEKKIEELEKNLDQDLILKGTVRELRDYGAFVDIGGMDGFLHVSEMSYSRINRASDFLSKDDSVRVKVIRVETVDGKKRISLSMKAVNEDPWNLVRDKYKDGQSYSGRVMKLESFGAFVELEPGVEGLIHISEMTWEKRIHHPSDVLAVGDQVQVRLLAIDEGQKRISLSLKNIDEDPWLKVSTQFMPSTKHEGQVISLKGFGAIVQLAEGLTGLLPMGTLKSAFGESYRKEASPPKTIEVIVKAIDDEQQKILLTLANAKEEEEDDQSYRDYLAKESKPKTEAKGQGSFGALLAAKLNEKK